MVKIVINSKKKGGLFRDDVDGAILSFLQSVDIWYSWSFLVAGDASVCRQTNEMLHILCMIFIIH